MESELLKRNFFLQLKEVITFKYSFLLAKAQTILSNHLILIAYLIIRSDIENLWSFMRLQYLPKFCNYSSHLFLSENDHNKWTHWLHSPEISLTWKFFLQFLRFQDLPHGESLPNQVPFEACDHNKHGCFPFHNKS